MATVLRNRTAESIYIKSIEGIHEIKPGSGLYLGDGYDYEIVNKEDE